MLSTKIASTCAAAAMLFFAAQSSAAEVSVNTYIGKLLSSAVTVAQQEIQYSVQESVLNATHGLSLSAEEPVKANVSIKEIAQSETVVEMEEEQAE